MTIETKKISAVTANNATDNTINIDDATYRTILLHAEKISNGQNFGAVLKNELRNLLNVDASDLVEAIKTDSDVLNRVRCYLADFNLIITNDEGTRYHLVKLTDDYCELDIINDKPAIEQEENAVTTTENFLTKSYNRYGACRTTTFATLDEAIADARAEVAENHDNQIDIIHETGNRLTVIETIEWKPEPTTRDNYLAAKKEGITVRHNFDNGRDEWYINGKRTNKKTVAAMLKNYNLTLDSFKAEHEVYIGEQIAKGARQMAIDDQAEHFADKVVREAKACDDNDVFTLLPELDELDDVSEAVAVKEEIINAYGKTFSFINIGGERVSFIDGEVHVISSDKYNAHFNRQTGKYVVAIVEDGNYKAKTLDTDEEFFAEMSKRGACTVEEPEPPVDTDKPVNDDFATKLAELQAKRDAAQATLLRAQEEHESAENTLQKFLSDTAGDLTRKLQSLKLDYRIKLVKTLDWTFDPSYSVNRFNNVHIEWVFVGDGVTFIVENGIDTPLAKYDTPAQVDKVIDMLRAAIKRGAKEFKFPTVDELTTTRKAA